MTSPGLQELRALLTDGRGSPVVRQGAYGTRGNLALVQADTRDALWVHGRNDDAEDARPGALAGCWSGGMAFATGLLSGQHGQTRSVPPSRSTATSSWSLTVLRFPSLCAHLVEVVARAGASLVRVAPDARMGVIVGHPHVIETHARVTTAGEPARSVHHGEATPCHS